MSLVLRWKFGIVYFAESVKRDQPDVGSVWSPSALSTALSFNSVNDTSPNPKPID